MRLAALSTGFQINHLDHLGPLAALLNIPLITDEPRSVRLLDRLYPDVKVIFRSHSNLTIDYLSKTFDGLIISTRHYKNEMSPMFKLHGKEMIFIQSPHGNSDKEAITQYDGHSHAIIYGKQMRDMLKERNISIETLYEMGNYRRTYYQKHKGFYDDIVEREIAFPKKQCTILYAPTWQDAEDSSSLDEYGAVLLESLPNHLNLVVKLHPLSVERQPALTTQLIEQFSGRPNIQFLVEFPPVYPLFSTVDAYLGDFSSVGYDFLATGKPMFFINHDEREVGTYLYRCGMAVPKEGIFSFIERELDACNKPFYSIRKETFAYAFTPSCEALPSLQRELKASQKEA